ncbi:MAG: prolyl oligopeptidase family serine peptidase [Planctomycetales bacterium]|nr:prolyl oligopeptidase family serine peptidase [Planctomycetales bacterium]
MMRSSWRLIAVVFVLASGQALAAETRVERAQEIRYTSAADGSRQPAMYHAPRGSLPVPLLVGLHTWSGDYKQQSLRPIELWCIENGWAYIHPNFRGPNVRPEATGSELAVADIVSAVEYAKAETKIDEKAVYLVGASGGGYAALLMAGRHPEIWAGVSAWVPISDLRTWYSECKQANRKYYRNIAASCGGAPGESAEVDRQYQLRSPLTYLDNARGVELHIQAGIHDGHTGSVPVSHSLRAFNAVAAAEDRIAASDIATFVEKQAVPAHLQQQLVDPTFGEKRPLFRRRSGNATITIFEGGHEQVDSAVVAWLEGRQSGQ